MKNRDYKELMGGIHNGIQKMELLLAELNQLKDTDPTLKKILEDSNALALMESMTKERKEVANKPIHLLTNEYVEKLNSRYDTENLVMKGIMEQIMRAEATRIATEKLNQNVQKK